jgi:hypothetical protein
MTGDVSSVPPPPTHFFLSSYSSGLSVLSLYTLFIIDSTLYPSAVVNSRTVRAATVILSSLSYVAQPRSRHHR